MKKLVAAFIGLIMVSIAATSVSASEYEVEKGDNLWNIAIDNKTTVEELMEINDLKSSLIHPKQVLKIEQTAIEYYMVQEGDTLSEIRKAYGDDISVKDLKEWNDLSSDLIIVGQQLIVSDPGPGVKQEAEDQSEQTASVENQVTETEQAEETVSSMENNEQEVDTAEVNTQNTEEKAAAQTQETQTEEPAGRTFSVEATAYTAGCNGCSGITATGINLNNDPYAKVIAVDPNVIPLGTNVYVEGYGYAVAGDTGGAIKGNKIDIHVPTKTEAYNWGRRTVKITILE
ncbi:3D domain-containing protein [Oceanobacillus saliphilus]|uniref:3D domain-containing protein n=1 Tax=Oceanobacillus saliphilus TaxID=2925834 RepID=UPI00201D3D38|nr:3D domain-containing protein [Oceanobacillus saliphilus]